MANEELFAALGLEATGAGATAVFSPIDGAEIGRVNYDQAAGVDAKIAAAVAAFEAWRNVPPPKRGELIRLLGDELRAAKPSLGRLVSLESGKILAEGLGEVQEMIDICDFAVGQSRQLYGLTNASERPPDDGNLAPVGPDRRHQRFQLPGCRLGLEFRPGRGLRRSGDLEAVGKNAAFGARLRKHIPARGRSVPRSTGGPDASGHGRRRCGRQAGRREAPAPD